MITDITANCTDIIEYPSAEIFCEKVREQTISTMDRWGKDHCTDEHRNTEIDTQFRMNSETMVFRTH